MKFIISNKLKQTNKYEKLELLMQALSRESPCPVFSCAPILVTNTNFGYPFAQIELPDDFISISFTLIRDISQTKVKVLLGWTYASYLECFNETDIEKGINCYQPLRKVNRRILLNSEDKIIYHVIFDPNWLDSLLS